MPTLEELEKQLKDIQAAIEEAKKREQEGGILPMEGDFYLDYGFDVETAYNTCKANGRDQNVFPDEETANAYGEAFSVMLELRRQPGSVAYDDYSKQYYINCYGSVCQLQSYNKTGVCPAFSPIKAAENARRAVGEDRIVAAYRTLTGEKA